MTQCLFNKLFISAYNVTGAAALRRRGKRGETDGCMALAALGEMEAKWYCTDRFAFYGRSNTGLPDMVACSKERPNDFKEVPIEPMLAQSVRIKLRPEQRSSVTFYTAAALNETELEELLKGLKSLDSRRESELAYAQAVARMNYYKIINNKDQMKMYFSINNTARMYIRRLIFFSFALPVTTLMIT